ncbi:ORF6N domain-containing protein [Candidatus Omnitrophota bacterium]
MKKKSKTADPIPHETIENKILLIRSKKVMLDKDLAELYKVDTRQLTRQVRRNIERFPDDFMFLLTRKELMNLKCQFGTSSWGGVVQNLS